MTSRMRNLFLLLAGAALAGCQTRTAKESSSPPLTVGGDTTLATRSNTVSSTSSGWTVKNNSNSAVKITSHNGTTEISVGPNVTFTSTTENGGETITWGGGPNLTTNLRGSISSASVHLVKVRSEYGGIRFVRSAVPGQISAESEVSFSGAQLSAAQRKSVLSGFKLALENVDGTLEISVKPPVDFPKGIGIGATYHIAVPAGLSIDARTTNGPLGIEDIGAGGTIAAESSYGKISIQNSGSSIDARTTNGPVSIASESELESVTAHSGYGPISISGPARSINADSSNGSVSASNAPNAKTVALRSGYGTVRVTNCGGEITADSSNGAVAYSAADSRPTSLNFESGYGHINAELGDCSALASANISTSNGSASLTFPKSSSLSIDAHTSNGSIHHDGISGDTDGGDYDKSFKTVLNGGKSRIVLESGYGSLTIQGR